MAGYKHSRLETADVKPLSAEIGIGEIAINMVDGLLYSKDSTGKVIPVGGSAGGTTGYSLAYIGVQLVDPTLRQNGSALQVGDLYFNSVEEQLKTYSNGVWISGTNLSGLVRDVYEETLTGDKVLFSIPYELGTEVVTLNGITLAPSDYTADDGTTILLNNIAVAGDTVMFTIYNHASITGVYTSADIDLKFANVIGNHIAVDDLNMNNFKIIGLRTPLDASDAATKGYADKLASRLEVFGADQIEAQIASGAATGSDAVKILTDSMPEPVFLDSDIVQVTKSSVEANNIYAGFYFYRELSNEWLFSGVGIPLPTTQLRADHTVPASPGISEGDIDLVSEVGFASINSFDGTSWKEILNEPTIKTWIAAGSLFQGTLSDIAAIGTLPIPAVANTGFYWTWTGPASTNVVASDFTNGGGFADVLQVGDWIQSTGTIFTHVPADLMSKQRWEAVGSFRDWVDGSYEKDSLVRYNSKQYKAHIAITVADTEPDVSPNWIDISSYFDAKSLTDVEVYTVGNLIENDILSWNAVTSKWSVRKNTLGSLEGVDIASVTQNQVLSYDAVLHLWVATDAATGGGGTTLDTYDPLLAYTVNSLVTMNDILYYSVLDVPIGLSPETDLAVTPFPGFTTNPWIATGSVGNIPVDPSETWDSIIEYSIGTPALHNNILYYSLVDLNIGNAPDASASDWIPILGDYLNEVDTKISFDAADALIKNQFESADTALQVSIDALATGLSHGEAAGTFALTSPASPIPNEPNIVKFGATGDWSGHGNEIATWSLNIGSGVIEWMFEPAVPGETRLVLDEGATYHWNGTDWVKVNDSTGANGADGAKGDKGDAGTNGTDGSDGVDGSDGMKTRVTGNILYISTDGTPA